jgi:hypothetical protein
MKSNGWNRLVIFLAVALVALAVKAANAELFINELHFDPGSSGQLLDTRDEYIELRGTPGMSLANHYLLFVENEDNELHTDATGNIENIFNLGNLTLGSNGFLLLRQDGNLYNDNAVAQGATSVEHNDNNAGVANGWGNGGGSLVFHQGINNAGFPKIELENGGATAMLIRNKVEVDGGLAPTLNFDLDQGNDGLDSRVGSTQAPLNDWAAKWEIVDSIGWLEVAEIQYGRSYGNVTFSADVVGQPVFEGGPVLTTEMVTAATEPGSSFAGIGFEIELLARWGNSTAHTTDDWHASNLTVDLGSGSAGVATTPSSIIDLRQSGDPHPSSDGDPNTPAPQPEFIESSKDVPYGTKIADSLGGPNYITGDFNKDGLVDTADYVVWRKTLNAAGSESSHPLADPNHDFVVNASDLDSWMLNFGSPGTSLGGGSLASQPGSSVPEPVMSVYAVAACATLVLRRHSSNTRGFR